MGLAKKLIFGGLIVGAFFFGREMHRTNLNDTYRFIDKNPKYTTQVFMYARDKLEAANPSFLDSLNMNSLNDEQRKVITEDYIKNKIKGTYEDGREFLQDLFSSSNSN